MHVSIHWLNCALTAAAVVIAAVVRQHYHRRAMAKDHVAEVSHDVTIPRVCANCGSPDAPFRWPVTANLVGPGGLAAAIDSRVDKLFVFRFCLHCARMLRRRRRLGSLVIIAGICSLLFIPLSIALLKLFPSVTRFVNTGPEDWWFDLLIAAFFIGPLLIASGMTLYSSTPPVAVIDTGEKTIFFRFRNQAFRDSFAAANGESAGYDLLHRSISR